MIYFLVNNDYHFLDVLENIKHLKDYEKCLIQIPHRLNVIESHKDFKKVYTFNSPFKNLNRLYNFFKTRKILKENPKLEIKSSDILFFYTEYEILNQVIASEFKLNGGKVFLIEEGLATYLTYSALHKNPLPLKQQLQLFYLKNILRYHYIEFLNINNIIFPQISEKYLDGLLLYLDVNINRNIKKYLIKKEVTILDLDPQKALFLNERIYDYYCSKKDFELIIYDIIDKISFKFKNVWFKFHPSETVENKKWIKKILSGINNIIFIEESEPIEILITKYNSKYVFSFFSAALLNLYFRGVIPIYIFHIYDKISKQEVSKNVRYILDNLNYNFIKSNFSNIEDVGFKNKSDIKHNIKDIIEGCY